MSQLNLWASIAFAYAGLELCAVMGDEIKDPRRTLPRSIYIAAPFIAFLYIAGTASLLWLVPSSEVHIVSGFFQAMAAGARDLGGLAWLIPLPRRCTCWATSAASGPGSPARRGWRSSSDSTGTSRRRSAGCIPGGRRPTSPSSLRRCSPPSSCCCRCWEEAPRWNERT